MEFAAMDAKSTVNGTERRVRTLKEVAVILGISRGSAYEAAKRKEIPTIRIGRRLVVPDEALQRLLSGSNGHWASDVP
jgi:excisionase family DNA binding protein